MVLIFIVAYNAKNHIRSVLDRLPREVFNHPQFHVLIIDDCSGDNTAQAASVHVSESQYKNVTVLRNPINQGYGGNQKLGYRYAIENGYDLVVLLHGDGQYAPELVMEFVETWKKEKADVILGSRMIEKSQARAGGMPIYKWLGNQILTWFQNVVVGSDLSEFHTGYRAYATSFLKQIPFELNTNDFHFDTEILLQAFTLKAKFAEFPIPTYYGDEICHVNGMQYAKNVAISCLKYRFQKIGFFSSMQYRGLLGADSFIERSTRHPSFQRFLSTLMKQPSHVLIMGNHVQFLVHQLEKGGHKTDTLSIDETQELKKNLSHYNVVIAPNILEQLSDSERFLVDCRYNIESGLNVSSRPVPRFMFSTKNVAFLGLRILLGFGLFNYGERGILTMNTKRLFTLASFRRMLKETGFIPGHVRGFGLPFHLLFPNRFGLMLTNVSDFFAWLWPSLFAYQLVIEATPTPHAYRVLSHAEKYYEHQNQL